MSATGIAWTDYTWNPAVGCSKVSPGCKNCYAEGVHEMRRKAKLAGKKVPDQYLKPFGEVQLLADRLAEPLHWKTPRKVFVCSMSDLFHADVPFEYIAAVFGVMAACPQHTFQVLTKRADRMAEFFQWLEGRGDPSGNVDPRWLTCHKFACDASHDYEPAPGCQDRWPLPNVHLGVTVEDQKRADERIPLLLKAPAAIRFLSMEPLLGPVDLDKGRCDTHDRDFVDEDGEEICSECAADGWSGELSYGHWLDPLNGGIDWVIVGGESGKNARVFDLAWARSIVAKCQSEGVPVFVKQLGACASDEKNGIAGRGLKVCSEAAALVSLRLKDPAGADPEEWPEYLRVRQFPEALGVSPACQNARDIGTVSDEIET